MKDKPFLQIVFGIFVFILPLFMKMLRQGNMTPNYMVNNIPPDEIYSHDILFLIRKIIKADIFYQERWKYGIEKLILPSVRNKIPCT